MARIPLARSPRLADQVYDAICESIVSGDLEPGQRLIFEELGADLGVSLTPIRDASIRLLRDGLATPTASGRLQVVPMTAAYVKNVYAVRIPLEGVAASLAAEHLTAGDLAELRAAFAGLNADTLLAQREQLRGAAHLLHARIHEESNNPILIRELQALHTHAQYILGYIFRRFGTDYSVSLDEHLAILDALAEGDPEAARRTMEAHMGRARDRIVALIEAEAPSS